MQIPEPTEGQRRVGGSRSVSLLLLDTQKRIQPADKEGHEEGLAVNAVNKIVYFERSFE